MSEYKVDDFPIGCITRKRPGSLRLHHGGITISISGSATSQDAQEKREALARFILDAPSLLATARKKREEKSPSEKGEALHPKRRAILEQIEEQELEEVVLLDGLDSAILGLVAIPNNVEAHATVIAYSMNLILASLCADGMDEEEALEYFHFNIGGGYLGKGTPVFVQDDFEEAN